MQVERLAHALQSEGLDLWWDKHIEAGEKFRPAIQQQLITANCVMVLWTKQSIKSSWVLQESSQALESGSIVPVLLESVTPPMPFGEIQNADLSHWKGEIRDPAFQKLVKTLRRKISSCDSEINNQNEMIEEVITSDTERVDEVIDTQDLEERQNPQSPKYSSSFIVKHWKATLFGLGTIIMTSFGVVGGYLDVKQLLGETFGAPKISIEQSAKRDLRPDEVFSITYKAPSIGYLSLWQINPDGSVERQLPPAIMDSLSVPSRKQSEPMRFGIDKTGTTLFTLLWTPNGYPEHLSTYEYESTDNFDAAVKVLSSHSKVAKAQTSVIVIPKP